MPSEKYAFKLFLTKLIAGIAKSRSALFFLFSSQVSRTTVSSLVPSAWCPYA